MAPQAALTTFTVNGKLYRIIPHPDMGGYQEDEQDETAIALPPGASGSSIPANDRFAGTARRVAKTKIIPGTPQSFVSVADLLDWLPPNTEMVDTIGKTATTDRVEKEKHNVTVKGFIYAFKKEADNDYHIVIGDAPGSPHPRFLNTEVSGIPIGGTDDNRAKLSDVRNEFKSTFKLAATGPGSYFRPDPPVPVRITGSIFWDVDHEHPPYVGPGDFKPQTPWEIHPISTIEFLDN